MNQKSVHDDSQNDPADAKCDEYDEQYVVADGLVYTVTVY